MHSNFSQTSTEMAKQTEELDCTLHELIQLVLDGEATEEQKKTFENYCSDCHPDSKDFLFEKACFELLKETLQQHEKFKVCAPSNLCDEIKSQVLQQPLT